ncbi:urea ABC transporter permease subunit UrtB, partial [Cronobacter sakazakii]
QRLDAARTLQRDGDPQMAPLLTQRLAVEKDDTVRDALSSALASLQLASPDATVRLNAVTRLGESGDPQTRARLQPFTDAASEPDARVREAAAASVRAIDHRLMVGDLLGQAFMGLSLGSILLLAA